MILGERQRQYIGQLATVSRMPITFNGTTFFPMLDASRVEGSVEFCGNGTMRSGHARRIRVVTKNA